MWSQTAGHDWSNLARAHTYTQTHACAGTHTHTHAHTHACARTHTRTCTHIQTHTHAHVHAHTHTVLIPLCAFSHSVLSTKMGTLTICFFRLETRSYEKSSNLPKATQIKGGPSDSRAQYLNTTLCSLQLGYTVSYFLFPNKLLFQLPRFTLSLASLPINF